MSAASLRGISVKVLDIDTNETKTYSSINKAAEALDVSQQRLSYHFQKTNSFILKGRYQIEKVRNDSEFSLSSDWFSVIQSKHLIYFDFAASLFLLGLGFF